MRDALQNRFKIYKLWKTLDLIRIKRLSTSKADKDFVTTLNSIKITNETDCISTPMATELVNWFVVTSNNLILPQNSKNNRLIRKYKNSEHNIFEGSFLIRCHF